MNIAECIQLILRISIDCCTVEFSVSIFVIRDTMVHAQHINVAHVRRCNCLWALISHM